MHVDPNAPIRQVPEAELTTSGVADAPPAKIPRKQASQREFTSGEKLLRSLVFVFTRLPVGTIHLASGVVKGIISGVALGVAKTGLLKGKSDAISEFASAGLRDTRRDFSKGFILVMAGIFAPIGHLWTVWDKSESWGKATEFDPVSGHFGSEGKKVFHFLFAQIEPPYVKPDPHPHTWKKIENKLDWFSDFLTGYEGIEKAFATARRKAHLPSRIPLEEPPNEPKT